MEWTSVYVLVHVCTCQRAVTALEEGRSGGATCERQSPLYCEVIGGRTERRILQDAVENETEQKQKRSKKFKTKNKHGFQEKAHTHYTLHSLSYRTFALVLLHPWPFRPLSIFQAIDSRKERMPDYRYTKRRR